MTTANAEWGIQTGNGQWWTGAQWTDDQKGAKRYPDERSAWVDNDNPQTQEAMALALQAEGNGAGCEASPAQLL